jgi:hypothetical protein
MGFKTVTTINSAFLLLLGTAGASAGEDTSCGKEQLKTLTKDHCTNNESQSLLFKRIEKLLTRTLHSAIQAEHKDLAGKGISGLPGKMRAYSSGCNYRAQALEHPISDPFFSSVPITRAAAIESLINQISGEPLRKCVSKNVRNAINEVLEADEPMNCHGILETAFEWINEASVQCDSKVDPKVREYRVLANGDEDALRLEKIGNAAEDSIKTSELTDPKKNIKPDKVAPPKKVGLTKTPGSGKKALK